MTNEYAQLHHARKPFAQCPRCGQLPFTPFLRGLVQRPARSWYSPWKKRPYCAVICYHCKNIVGYEAPGMLTELAQYDPKTFGERFLDAEAWCINNLYKIAGAKSNGEGH